MRWAVILAGGSGTRFWPLSTPRVPKQLLPLCGAESTAEAAVSRLTGLVDRSRILLVTGRHLAGPLAARLGIETDNVLVEPVAKSTAPALAWATHVATRRDPKAAVLSLHADWYVPDVAAFQRVAAAALEVAEREPCLVTVGVVPTRPETGYGYLVPGEPTGSAFRVARFKEKPTPTAAEELIAGGALWNSGLFAWRGSVLRTQLERHTPEISRGLGELDHGNVAGFFDGAQEISIDVGLLERSPDVLTVRGDFAWDDVGTWEALARVRPPDSSGNVLVGPVSAVSTTDSIGWSEGTPLVLAGMNGIVAVAANGRLLVMPRSKAAELKQVLDALPRPVREV
ncbi:MAG: hypothetical protein FJ206_13370 [Gemmatimonadetes bacterium]|nr:hypothetical protein [Gemmatimonadota bacterium]